MGSLANRLESRNVAAGNWTCRLCVKLGELNSADAAVVLNAMAQGISVQDLYVTLREEGHRVPRNDIVRHKKEGHL